MEFIRNSSMKTKIQPISAEDTLHLDWSLVGNFRVKHIVGDSEEGEEQPKCRLREGRGN